MNGKRLRSPLDSRNGHCHKAIDFVSNISTTVGTLHEDDAYQVFGWVHPPVGPIRAALYKTANRVIAESAKNLTDHLEAKSVPHAGSKTRFHGAGLRCGHGFHGCSRENALPVQRSEERRVGKECRSR